MCSGHLDRLLVFGLTDSTPDAMLAALSDHATSPGICRHEDGTEASVTVFWCLADVTAGEIRYGRGRPCLGREACSTFA